MRKWLTQTGRGNAAMIEPMESRVLLSSAPHITGVNPDPLNITGPAGHIFFTISGSNFNFGTSLEGNSQNAKLLLTGPNGQSVDEVQDGEVEFPDDTSTSITLFTPDFTFDSIPPGHWTVQVVNPDGTASNKFGFEVSLAGYPPVITGVTPQPAVSSPAGGHVYLTIEGSNFQINLDSFSGGAGDAAVLLTSPNGVTVNEVADQEVNLGSSTDTAIYIETPDLDMLPPGMWTAQVINPAGGASAKFKFTVQAPLAPTITQQPLGQTVRSGSNVTFSVAAKGNTPLTYQWEYNGNAISGQTNSTLTLNNVKPSQAGAYSVVVTAYGTSVTSNTATLTVHSPCRDQAPTITGVSPDPVNIAGSSGHRYFYISGSNFNLGTALEGNPQNAKLILTGPNGQSVDEVADAEVQYPDDTSTSITLFTPDFTINSIPPGQWTVQVINPDGMASNKFAFYVTLHTCSFTGTPRWCNRPEAAD